MHPHPAIAFVHAFHDDLSRWFSGSGDRAVVWSRLKDATPADMTLIYPSGRAFSGAAFLESIEDRWGSSPAFRASIADGRIVAEAPDHAVVAYTESQDNARASTAQNARTALAVVRVDGDTWRWSFIQETSSPA